MHTHYKGTGRVHSFRGLLDHDAQRKISIQGAVGATAWRITKFASIDGAPGTAHVESIMKIYREEQSSIDGSVNFDDAELLGVSYYSESDEHYYPGFVTVIFDNTIFTRDIFVTNFLASTQSAVNYYIELEEVTVSAAGKGQLALAAARRTGER